MQTEQQRLNIIATSIIERVGDSNLAFYDYAAAHKQLVVNLVALVWSWLKDDFKFGTVGHQMLVRHKEFHDLFRPFHVRNNQFQNWGNGDREKFVKQFLNYVIEETTDSYVRYIVETGQATITVPQMTYVKNSLYGMVIQRYMADAGFKGGIDCQEIIRYTERTLVLAISYFNGNATEEAMDEWQKKILPQLRELVNELNVPSAYKRMQSQ